MSETSNDWLDDMLDGWLPSIDWKTQSYLIRLTEESTLDELDQDALIDRIIEGRFKEGEVEELKNNLIMNALPDIEFKNPSQKSIRDHIRRITNL